MVAAEKEHGFYLCRRRGVGERSEEGNDRVRLYLRPNRLPEGVIRSQGLE